MINAYLFLVKHQEVKLLKIAQTNDGQLLYLTSYQQAVALKAQQCLLFCSQCHQLLTICTTKKHGFYFAHQHTSTYYCNETQQHRSGKQLLLNWCQQAGISALSEKWICNHTQRADILLPQQNIILELQCSPLSKTALSQRTQAYTQHHYRVIWLLGQRYRLNKNYLTSQQRQFLNYQQHYGFYLLFLHVQQQQLCCYHHLRQSDWGKLQYQQQVIPFKQLFKIMPCQSVTRHHNNLHELLRQTQKCQRALHYRSSQIQKYQLACYRHGYDLTCVPLLCHETNLLPPLFAQPLLFTNIMMVLWLKQHQQITLQTFYTHYQRSVTVNTPLLSPSTIKQITRQCARQLLHRLYQTSCITSNKQWLVINQNILHKQWFPNLESKLIAIKKHKEV